MGVISDETLLTQGIDETRWQRGIAIIDGAGGIPTSRPTRSKNHRGCSQCTAVIVGFAATAVQRWIGRRHTVHRRHHITRAIIASVRGNGSGALIRTITIDLDGGGQPLGWCGNGRVRIAGDTLIISNVLAPPHVTAGVVGFAVGHFIDIVIRPAPAILIVGGVGPFLGEIGNAGIGRCRTLDRFLGQVMIVAAGLKASRAGVVVIGVVTLYPGRTGTIRSLIERGHTFEHDDDTGGIGQVQETIT